MTATAMKPWAEIPEGRERDKAVIIHVLGMEWVDGPGYWSHKPCCTTDAHEDYRVLEFVRREFTEKQKMEFCRQLAKLLRIRDCDYSTIDTLFLAFLGNGDANGIQTGMISAAAYEAKRLEGER